MVLAETAMAAALLAGTGLMTRSFQALVDTDPGFDSADEWALRFQINAAEGPVQLAEDRQRLLDIARDVPGVLSVGGSKTPLLDGGGEAYGFTIDGPTGEPVPVTPESGTYLVLPDFFGTLGTRFVAGRPFTADDSRTSIVGNCTLAESLWPGEDPLSKHLNLGNNVLPALAPIGVEAEAVVGLVISPIDPCARYRRTKTAWKSSRRWS